MTNLRKSFCLPNMAREEEATSDANTMDDEDILEVFRVAEAKEHMCSL